MKGNMPLIENITIWGNPDNEKEEKATINKWIQYSYTVSLRSLLVDYIMYAS